MLIDRPCILPNYPCFSSIASGGGKHWFLLFESSDEILELFDSLGSDKEYIRTYLPYNAIYEYNTFPVQCNNSELCGKFVLYFVVFRYFNLDGEFEDVLNEIFTTNCSTNEARVNKFLSSL